MASLHLRIRSEKLWELLSEHLIGYPKSVRMRTAVACACVLQAKELLVHLTALSTMSNDGLSSLICHACVGMALSSRMCCAAEAHVVRHILRHRCKRKWQTALRYDRHVRHGCKSCCLLHLPRCALNNRAVRCVWRAHVYVKTSHECAESRVLTKQADTHTHTRSVQCAFRPATLCF